MDFVIDKDEIVIEIAGTDDLPHLQAVAEAAASAVVTPDNVEADERARCDVLGCANQAPAASVSKEVRFHVMPTDPARLSLWVDAIRRSRGEHNWEPKSSTRICSAHFLFGTMSERPEDINYVPTIFPHKSNQPPVSVTATKSATSWDRLIDQVNEREPVHLTKQEEVWKEPEETDAEFDQSRGLLQALWRDESSKDMVVIAGQGELISCHASVFAMASEFTRTLLALERSWEEVDNARVYLSLPEFGFVTVIKFLERMYCLEGDEAADEDSTAELMALASVLRVDQVRLDEDNIKAAAAAATRMKETRSKGQKRGGAHDKKLTVTLQRNREAFDPKRWPDHQGKGPSVTATAQAQLRIRKQLSKLGGDMADEPVAKRVKRRTDRIKLEPDDDFLDPDFVLRPDLTSSRPGRGRGPGRPRKQPRFLEEDDLEDETHGEVEWYKPELKMEAGEVASSFFQPRQPRGRRPGRPPLGAKRHLCPASTEAENEQDLANKGLDFLQKHAAEHKIPKKKREGKAADLASVLWKHYRLAHYNLKLNEEEIKRGKKISRPCWKCGNSVDISEKYCKVKRREWGLMSGTALLTFFECKLCNGTVSEITDEPDKPSSCKSCKLFYLGGEHICPPATQTCPWQDCGQVFQSWSKMEYHLNKHKGLKPFSCDNCDFSTHSLTQLQIVHKGRGKCPNATTIASIKRSKLDQCDNCPEPNTASHQAEHHNPDLQPYQCEECEYRSVSIEIIDIHKGKYHKELGYKTPKFQCSQCPQMLTRKTQKEHDKLHHSENLPFACDECNFRALLHGSILYHKGRWHREKKFECRLGCGESYTTRSYRDSHERRWCVKSTEKEALKQKEIEDGTRARETERCKQLAAKTQDRYSRLHTDDPSLLVAVKCGLCTYAALTTEEVQAHIDRAHPEEAAEGGKKKKRKSNPLNPDVQQYYQCPKCPIMIHRYMLKQHDEEHHNVSLPFGCPNCEYRALSKMAIACHVTKYHKAHDKHMCQLGCGKSFTSDFYMKYHMKRYCINSKEKEETIRQEDLTGVTAKKRAFKREAKDKNLKRKVAYNNLRPEHVIACKYMCGLRFAEMLYMERHASFTCTLRPPKLEV